MGDGETVLVIGATGGLGGLIGALALGSPAGNVTGVIGSASKREAALEIGYAQVVLADELSYVSTTEAPFDVVFDTVGGDLRKLAFEHLAPLGRLILLGNASGQDVEVAGDQIWLGSRTVSGLSVGGVAHLEPDLISSAASEVLDRVADGSFRARPAKVLDLAGAAEAHRLLESRGVTGKIVLKVASLDSV